MPTPVRYPFGVKVSVAPPDPARQPPDSTWITGVYPGQSTTISKSWGLQPASASIRYAGDLAPVSAGHFLTIQAGGHTFAGICMKDTPEVGTDGKFRTIEFNDFREFLSWDDVYGYFNKVNKVTVSGARYRRYEHILPNDWIKGIKTYTNNPLTATQIISYLITAPYVQSPWQIRYVDPSTGAYTVGYHPSFANPAYDIDCYNGKTLGQALEEVCEQHGVLFTIGDNPYDLVFARKGQGAIPSFPTTSNNRRSGTVLSKNATRYRIVGERNVYQCHGINMTPDWAPGWYDFFDESKLQDWIFNNLKLNGAVNGIPSGTPYNSVPGDVEQTIGRQLAAARALEITVAQFASLRDSIAHDGNAFRDYRKFANKPRMDMPASIYIRTVLFRAFRIPSNYTIVTASGVTVPLASLELVSEMIAQVSHDPVTGVFFWDNTLPSDGPGYAIVQGYQVGQDGFKSINPARFNLDEWVDTLNLWQQIPFQIDDSGDVDKFIIFDQPIVYSDDLFVANTTELNGYAGLNSDPTFFVPSVQAALTFKAERFQALFGFGTKDQTVNNSELHEEYLGSGSGWVSNKYADGRTAYQKAQTIADSLLLCQYTYADGGFTRPLVADAYGVFPAGTKLTGVIDRVTLRGSESGMIEEVDFTSERKPRSFIADREFDRIERDKGLFPGQKEQVEKANQLKMIASALKSRPDIMLSMAEALHGRLSKVVVDTTKVPPTGIKVYTPLKKKPTAAIATPTTKPTNTRSVVYGDSAFSVFSGICVTDLEAGGLCRVKDSGTVPCRVKGPVLENEAVGLDFGSSSDYLSKTGGTPFATVLQPHSGTDVKVVMVRISGSGGSSLPVWL